MLLLYRQWRLGDLVLHKSNLICFYCSSSKNSTSTWSSHNISYCEDEHLLWLSNTSSSIMARCWVADAACFTCFQATRCELKILVAMTHTRPVGLVSHYWAKTKMTTRNALEAPGGSRAARLRRVKAKPTSVRPGSNYTTFLQTTSNSKGMCNIYCLLSK